MSGLLTSLRALPCATSLSTAHRARRPQALGPLAVVLGASLAGGCILSPVDGDETSNENHPLAPCADGSDIDDQTVIVADYDQSIHEMVACGGLTVTLVASITAGIIEAVLDNRSDATPSDWEFREGGVYYTNGAAAEMTASFYLAADFEFGSKGELLTENLFQVGTYLTGARVVAEVDSNDPFNSRVELQFDGTGPYVELLGFGPNPQSPLAVDLSTWDQITSRLEALEFDSQITVNDMQSQSTIRYDVSSAKMPVSQLLGGGMGYALQMADGSRADLGQSLVVQDWSIDFVDQSPGALDGEVRFTVEGGAFEYEGTMVYDNSTYGEASLRCPQ